MDLFVQGEGPVRLGQGDFVAQGGEAAVYARGDRAFKVYHDPAKMMPAGKIQELAVLAHPNIIRPEAVLLDARNRPVGYTMRRVPGAHVLCQLFNRSFRERKRVSADRILALVRKLQEGVAHVHGHGILVVDLNEMNFLLDDALAEVWFIDVDSYQTPGFPASALMESVRDRHAAAFSRETDWFAFAIVTFQLFAGIHPYRGKHPDLPDLDARMHANVSVLNPSVTVPQVCYPFDQIPPVYLAWYRALFEEGRHLPPPAAAQAAVFAVPVVQQLPGSDHLAVRELARFPAAILLPIPEAGNDVALTTAGLFARGQNHPVGPDARAAFTPRMQRLVVGWVEGRRLLLYDVTAGRLLPDPIQAEALTACDGRFYFKNGASLYELEFMELPAGVRARSRPVGNALEHATTLFDGVAIQSVLGACYASLFPQAGACHSVRLKELDGCRVVDARFDRGVLMALAEKDGRYDRFVFRFDRRCAGYDARVVADVPPAALNFVVLESGVAVHLTEEEDLELFAHRPGTPGIKRLTDPALQGARLFRRGTQLLFTKGDRLYSATMKGTGGC